MRTEETAEVKEVAMAAAALGVRELTEAVVMVVGMEAAVKAVARAAVARVAVRVVVGQVVAMVGAGKAV